MQVPRMSRAAIAFLLCCLASACSVSEDVTSKTSEFLIINAVVIDGSAAAAKNVSVRVHGERIAEIGALEAKIGEIIVDAKGLVLAPGFIDTHSHHDISMREDPSLLPAVSQGVATIVVGQDGSSEFPIENTFAYLDENPIALNFVSYVGHNTIRNVVLGTDNKRAATASEIKKMALLVRSEIESGALGLSTGLEYEPGIYSEHREVLELAKSAAAVGGRYSSHIRSEDRAFWEAIDEAIVIGRETEMPVHISHIKLSMRSLLGETEKLLRTLDQAREDGIEITADIYPYEFWESTMEVFLPSRDLDNRTEFEFALRELVAPEDYYIISFAADPSLVGKSMAEIARDRGIDPVDTYIALVSEARHWKSENPQSKVQAESVMGRSMRREDIEALMLWPHTNIGSDGSDKGHPRGRGTYPRVLGRYVRDQKTMSLEIAIHKMTALAAKNIGLTNRGLIKPGYFADLTLFDPETVIDHADIDSPDQLSSGIAKVWVNGTLVFQHGGPTGRRPGTLIRHE